ncbi:hypothetical protein I5M27_13505 [Adhaeribacter sp. BT258]|uniref:STAS/SEC14 domain-containing protein n=1 Tax=Adhaeribacter terrigena TaxID=2793070 RepID=A0ABS1C3M7_9BACT|nr:STAS/SEC14 domain-containing protein [Adhaeribacter terrigena]MBK0404005.1 hypothetical protein [Adhaeribacter terrigena]
MLQFDKPFATIEIEPEKSLLILTWHGFANSDEYREANTVAIQISRQYNLTKWLNNMKEMKAIRQADQEWSVNEWLPLFKSLHIQKWALVIADDMFNQMAMSSMMSKIRPQLTHPVEYFQDLNSARTWIERA